MFTYGYMGGFRGVSGVSGNPLGVSKVFPQLLFTAKWLWPHVYPMWLSASLPMDHNSCRPPDPVQTQLSSIPVQQADAEQPEKQRQIQVNCNSTKACAELYTLSLHAAFQPQHHVSKCYCCMLRVYCLPQLHCPRSSIRARKHQKYFGGIPPDPLVTYSSPLSSIP